MLELVSYTSVVHELRTTDALDEQCVAIIFDSQSGELFAWHGEMSSVEAVSAAAVLYNAWSSQDETARQHDDQLQIMIMANAENINCLSQIRPINQKRDRDLAKEGYTLAIIGPKYVQIGALKRLCQQMTQQLQPVLYAQSSSSSRKK